MPLQEEAFTYAFTRKGGILFSNVIKSYVKP